MVLTQKETMLLEDLKTQEQLCSDKYAKYAEEAKDEKLKELFTQIGDVERQHLSIVSQMLQGSLPDMSGGNQMQPQTPEPSYPAGSGDENKQKDAYLCTDALATEKHASSLYDVCIFEFKSEDARNVLNHIQKEEQGHGKSIYDYMVVNGMYG